MSLGRALRSLLLPIGRPCTAVSSQPLAVYRPSHQTFKRCTMSSAADVAKAAASPLRQSLAAMGLANQWFIAKPQREQLEAMHQLTTDQLLQNLTDVAASLARAPVSNFHVGAVMLTDHGHIFLGANQEFDHQAIGMSIHAEQAAISNIAHHPDAGIPVTLAVNAAPCGHCRQFIVEMHNGIDMRLLLPQKEPLRIADVLPHAFLPKDLNNQHPLLVHPTIDLAADGPHEVLHEGSPGTIRETALLMASVAARKAYAPYSGCHSAVALRLRDGRVLRAWYMENAAFNPSLPAAQSAYLQCKINGVDTTDVEVVVLAERIDLAMSHRQATLTLWRHLAPDATILYQPLKAGSRGSKSPMPADATPDDDQKAAEPASKTARIATEEPVKVATQTN